MHVVALAGGVGGARLALGLARTLPPGALTVIVNTGDDFELYGLHISPDLDTVTYTLAGLVNPDPGWGLAGDTFACLEMIGRYGEDTWFRLGDRDMATHILRTAALRRGETLTEITARLAAALGVRTKILPMTDDPVATMIITANGEKLEFQDYFVRRRWQPVVRSVVYEGAEVARLPKTVQEAVKSANAIVIAPSNPILSIDPILAVPGMRELIADADVPRIAVSPIVGGKAIKGPAAKLMREMGMEPAPAAIAAHYNGLIDGLVFDIEDEGEKENIEASGISTLVTDTIMRTDEDKIRLAAEILDWIGGIRE